MNRIAFRELSLVKVAIKPNHYVHSNTTLPYPYPSHIPLLLLLLFFFLKGWINPWC